MGVCYEQRADRTRFIIEEDYKIKQEMIQSIKTFNEKRWEEQRKKLQKQYFAIQSAEYTPVDIAA